MASTREIELIFVPRLISDVASQLEPTFFRGSGMHRGQMGADRACDDLDVGLAEDSARLAEMRPPDPPSA